MNFNNRKYTKLWLSALVIFMAGIGWIAWTQYLIHSAERQRVPEHADVGIVLGASLWGNVPSPGLQERLDHAYKLYKAGVFTKIIVSGGYDRLDSELTEAQGMKNYLVGTGIPSQHILEENKARSTYQNLLFSKVIMEEQGFRRAVIITHDYHGARSADIASFLEYSEPVVSTTNSSVLNMTWHKSRETLAYTKWMMEKGSLWIKRIFTTG
ncbi:hypothetical protein SY83_18045 [Paenibacillus swuensis]|uniref:DUF218 domain-containing protein n=1 Tax=Paenibacillus swuensis TaxID=1178515 RepID=A0A172TLD2_9BACL|nr:YdcF family protein [Paenibacillus swuensis]ANE47879.1 hypothetical protein SY83_18045 [Paenibacillus swuensis]